MMISEELVIKMTILWNKNETPCPSGPAAHPPAELFWVFHKKTEVHLLLEQVSFHVTLLQPVTPQSQTNQQHCCCSLVQKVDMLFFSFANIHE